MADSGVRPKWRRWRAALIAMVLLFSLFSAYSPVTYARAWLLARRICDMAEAGAFARATGKIVISEILSIHDSLGQWFRKRGDVLAEGCKYDVTWSPFHSWPPDSKDGDYIVFVRNAAYEDFLVFGLPEPSDERTARLSLGLSYSIFLQVPYCLGYCDSISGFEVIMTHGNLR